MEFNSSLVGKIVDPIHGIIRLSELEVDVIDHPLFQRLRNIKQNTFVYKVFPSAMHSRFEHSLGVMHLSYEIFKNLMLNSHRCKSADVNIFKGITDIDEKHIQELRLAALLHDIGHGPMSHDFDSIMCKKGYLKDALGDDFDDVFNMTDSKITHEHVSIILIKIIFKTISTEKANLVNIDNIIKMIESGYKDKKIDVTVNDSVFDMLPLFTSIISSCPLDADRMDYLLRDSYFAGVKCGVYDYDRLFMSIIPIMENNKVFLAYKESGIDSLVDFINSRASLFMQVYYHKTNRIFSTMFSTACNIVKPPKNDSNKTLDLFEFKNNSPEYNLEIFEKFYIDNSDAFFLRETLPNLASESAKERIDPILQRLIERKPWVKVYESIRYNDSAEINDTENEDFVKKIEG
ncbi:HD domain-containing protein [Shewanella sp. VB17]|uniref:HD domain-containing protein n=1 Tax=Shewanella sp. VB17 TaxID=2739432 RepID=UPI0015678CB1|nr:HD domain-containing protein [Shewanella sp. VB17]NRD74630.1 HD domain-containing protein [Shewanella sp. VB17]